MFIWPHYFFDFSGYIHRRQHYTDAENRRLHSSVLGTVFFCMPHVSSVCDHQGFFGRFAGDFLRMSAADRTLCIVILEISSDCRNANLRRLVQRLSVSVLFKKHWFSFKKIHKNKGHNCRHHLGSVSDLSVAVHEQRNITSMSLRCFSWTVTLLDTRYLTADLACFLLLGAVILSDTRYLTADSACFLLSGAVILSDTRYMTTDLACFLLSGAVTLLDTRYLTADLACFLLSGVVTLSDTQHLTTDNITLDILAFHSF